MPPEFRPAEQLDHTICLVTKAFVRSFSAGGTPKGNWITSSMWKYPDEMLGHTFSSCSEDADNCLRGCDKNNRGEL